MAGGITLVGMHVSGEHVEEEEGLGGAAGPTDNRPFSMDTNAVPLKPDPFHRPNCVNLFRRVMPSSSSSLLVIHKIYNKSL